MHSGRSCVDVLQLILPNLFHYLFNTCCISVYLWLSFLTLYSTISCARSPSLKCVLSSCSIPFCGAPYSSLVCACVRRWHCLLITSARSVGVIICTAAGSGYWQRNSRTEFSDYSLTFASQSFSESMSLKPLFTFSSLAKHVLPLSVLYITSIHLLVRESIPPVLIYMSQIRGHWQQKIFNIVDAFDRKAFRRIIGLVC